MSVSFDSDLQGIVIPYTIRPKFNSENELIDLVKAFLSNRSISKSWLELSQSCNCSCILEKITALNSSILSTNALQLINRSTCHFVERIFKSADFSSIEPFIFEKVLSHCDRIKESTAILSACSNKRFDLVTLLIQSNKMDPALNDNQAIRFASSYGEHELVELLLSKEGVNPAVSSNFPLRLASLSGHHKVVKLLLTRAEVDPSDLDNFAITQSSRNKHHKVVKLLLSDQRVDPTWEKNYAIRYASELGHFKVVELLLARDDVDPTDVNNYAIRFASQNGHNKVVRLLLDRVGIKGVEEALKLTRHEKTKTILKNFLEKTKGSRS